MELRSGILDGCPIGEETLIETIHLLNQIGGVRMSASRWREHAVVLCLVAAQQQDILYAQELQVDEFILDVLDGCSAADDMWYDGYLKPLLYGCRYCDGAWSATNALSLELSVRLLVIDELAVVRSDVDAARVKVTQFVDGGKQAIRTAALQGR